MKKLLCGALALALLAGVSGCANNATPSNATFRGINASVSTTLK